jgi:hypothetical protein
MTFGLMPLKNIHSGASSHAIRMMRELRPFLISFGKFLLLGTTNLKNYWCWPEAPLGSIPTSEEPRSRHCGHKHTTQGGVGWILQLDHNGGRQSGEEDHAWQGDQQSSIDFSPQAK